MAAMDSQLAEVRAVVIVGTGLLGGSMGLGLRAVGFPGKIIGVGRRIETPQRARELGCIDEATTDLAAAVQSADLVVLATPLRSFPDYFARLARLGPPGLVMTDVGSTKGRVCEDARRLLPHGRAQRFVGSHPMAGGERQGPEHARADLCAGRPCVLTPQDDTDPAALALVEGLWRTLNMRLVLMSPEQHDQTAARISHLPHALAATLVEMAGRLGGLDIASSGFASATRMAGGDPELWVDIFRSNRREVLAAIEEFDKTLAGFRKILAEDREKELLDFLVRSQKAREAWMRSHQGQSKQEE